MQNQSTFYSQQKRKPFADILKPILPLNGKYKPILELNGDFQFLHETRESATSPPDHQSIFAFNQNDFFLVEDQKVGKAKWTSPSVYQRASPTNINIKVQVKSKLAQQRREFSRNYVQRPISPNFGTLQPRIATKTVNDNNGPAEFFIQTINGTSKYRYLQNTTPLMSSRLSPSRLQEDAIRTELGSDQGSTYSIQEKQPHFVTNSSLKSLIASQRAQKSAQTNTLAVDIYSRTQTADNKEFFNMSRTLPRVNLGYASPTRFSPKQSIGKLYQIAEQQRKSQIQKQLCVVNSNSNGGTPASSSTSPKGKESSDCYQFVSNYHTSSLKRHQTRSPSPRIKQNDSTKPLEIQLKQSNENIQVKIGKKICPFKIRKNTELVSQFRNHYLNSCKPVKRTEQKITDFPKISSQGYATLAFCRDNLLSSESIQNYRLNKSKIKILPTQSLLDYASNTDIKDLIATQSLSKQEDFSLSGLLQIPNFEKIISSNQNSNQSFASIHQRNQQTRTTSKYDAEVQTAYLPGRRSETENSTSTEHMQ